MNKVIKSTPEFKKCIWCGKKITEETAYMSKSDNQYDGRMIWCKTCVNEQYKNYYSKYNGDVAKGIFLACRKFDLPYIPQKLDMAINQLKDEEYSAEKVFSIYMTKIYFRHNLGDPICFDDGTTENIFIAVGNEREEIRANMWGLGLTSDEYDFLDYELEDWQKTHSCDNKAELTLLKEICLKELDTRKARSEGKDTAKLVTELQVLMKTASVDPAKANVANAGKALDTFGVWIKDIEEKRPAEWYEDQEKYKDIDGFGVYLENYVTRPIKNFLTGVRDFFVNDDIDANLDDTSEGDSDG